MHRSSAALLLIVAVTPIPARAVDSFDDCQSPRQFMCVSEPHGYQIVELCKFLLAYDVVRDYGCGDFLVQHACAEVLDTQVRVAGQYHGNCFGPIVKNCCQQPVTVDLSIEPGPGHGQTPAGLAFFVRGIQTARLGPLPQRHQLVIPPGDELTVFWLDDDARYNALGADVRWTVHRVRAAKGDPPSVD